MMNGDGVSLQSQGSPTGEIQHNEAELECAAKAVINEQAASIALDPSV